jgi:predicted MFS family arabinose efflux permease
LTVALDPIRTDWLGARPDRVQVISAFFIGIVGIVVAGLQPVLLGLLQATGRITAPEIGHAATLELLMLGVGAGLAGGLLERLPLRLVAVVAAAVYVAANLATLGAHGEGVTLVRGAAGLPGGVMIWVVTCVIVRAPSPARWAGVYLASQTLAQLVVAALLGRFAAGHPDGAPLAMAVLGVLAAIAAAGLPHRLDPLPREETASGLPPARGWTVLAAAALLQACVIGAWVYLEPLGAQAHLSASVVALATPLCLGAQVVGASCATTAANRLPWFAALVVAGLGLVATVMALAALPAATSFLVLETVFGFLWLFFMPFLTPLAIEADPTRRTAVLGPAANLIGAALGPLGASLLVGDSNARAALHLCAALALAGVALIFGLHLVRRRGLSPA